jgi:hypothetical protein
MMNKNDLILNGYIPLDKSWLMRMGFLDMLHDMPDITYLVDATHIDVSNDVKALVVASAAWMADMQHIPVGESGTLYRFLRFASWKLNRTVELHKEKTLIDRPMCNDPNIVKMSVEELLKLDDHTSQWASAAVLMGAKEIPDEMPCKLKVTFEARDHWYNRRLCGQCWDVRYDDTLADQAMSFINGITSGTVSYAPFDAEHYPFARAFDLITPGEGGRCWPSLAGHETNRIDHIEKALQEYKNDQLITSNDHRVVQALAMKASFYNVHKKFAFPECVAKSWPQFWKFLDLIEGLK